MMQPLPEQQNAAPAAPHFAGEPAGSSAAEQPGLFVDEEAEMKRHGGAMPPDKLLARAREVLSRHVHNCPEEDFAPDFQFSAPFIGPLRAADFKQSMHELQLEEAFPDLNTRYYHLRADPFEPGRVWVTLRPVATHLGTFRGKLPASLHVAPTGRRIEEPPQTASLLFSEQGTLRAFTMGYVMDRLQGDTGGLGGAFGLLYAIGCPFPVPEGKPWRPSWQLRLFNTGRSWIQAFLFACDRASSALLPERFLTQHRRGAP